MNVLGHIAYWRRAELESLDIMHRIHLRARSQVSRCLQKETTRMLISVDTLTVNTPSCGMMAGNKLHEAHAPRWPRSQSKKYQAKQSRHNSSQNFYPTACGTSVGSMKFRRARSKTYSDDGMSRDNTWQ